MTDRVFSGINALPRYPGLVPPLSVILPPGPSSFPYLAPKENISFPLPVREASYSTNPYLSAGILFFPSSFSSRLFSARFVLPWRSRSLY